LYDTDTKTVYAYGTTLNRTAVDVYWSNDNMHTWQTMPALSAAALKNRTVFNSSVGKGKLAGKVVWVMAYECAVSGTPGSWNTAFATAPHPAGPWTVPDFNQYRMRLDVEHADPTLRYVEEDGFWYCLTARKTSEPQPNAGWYFFMEIFRSRDLLVWENAPGMGSNVSIGLPLYVPNPAADKALAPVVAHDGDPADGTSSNRGWLTRDMAAFLGKLRAFWGQSPDWNSSDMDLCEYRNETVMYFNWGEQHHDNGLALAVIPISLASFLRGFWDAGPA